MVLHDRTMMDEFEEMGMEAYVKRVYKQHMKTIGAYNVFEDNRALALVGILLIFLIAVITAMLNNNSNGYKYTPIFYWGAGVIALFYLCSLIDHMILIPRAKSKIEVEVARVYPKLSWEEICKIATE